MTAIINNYIRQDNYIILAEEFFNCDNVTNILMLLSDYSEGLLFRTIYGFPESEDVPIKPLYLQYPNIDSSFIRDLILPNYKTRLIKYTPKLFHSFEAAKRWIDNYTKEYHINVFWQQDSILMHKNGCYLILNNIFKLEEFI